MIRKPTPPRWPGTIFALALLRIVDAEDVSNPLSDEALVAELAKHGFTASRHAITKYRHVLGISSPGERRLP